MAGISDKPQKDGRRDAKLQTTGREEGFNTATTNKQTCGHTSIEKGEILQQNQLIPMQLQLSVDSLAGAKKIRTNFSHWAGKWQTVLTVLTFEGTESQRGQNGGRF